MVSVGLFKIDLDIDQESINAPYIIDTITEQLEGFILEEVEADAEDGLFNIVEEISIRLQENYEELIGEDTDKRHFIKSLTRAFALLLNTKVDTVDKIKKSTKNCCRNNTKNMARKHFPKTSTIPLWLMNRHQRNQKRTR